MKSFSQSRQASLARDAGARRLRRVTQLAVAIMVALAAGSTHPKKTVAGAPLRRAAATVIAQAPAPPLVAAQGATPDSQAASAAAPVAAPVPSYSPPVVVSGGS